MTLQGTMKILKEEYLMDQRTWASWGDYDRKMLVSDCAAKGVEFPGATRSHQNIKNIVATTLGWSKEAGLPEALGTFGLEMKGTLHRGVDDALNIARIYSGFIEYLRFGAEKFC